MIDREVLDLMGQSDSGPVNPKLFTYLRYNADLSYEGLAALGLPSAINPEDVQKLDSVEHIPELQMVGQAVGNKVNIDHYAGFLN